MYLTSIGILRKVLNEQYLNGSILYHPIVFISIWIINLEY